MTVLDAVSHIRLSPGGSNSVRESRNDFTRRDCEYYGRLVE